MRELNRRNQVQRYLKGSVSRDLNIKHKVQTGEKQPVLVCEHGFYQLMPIITGVSVAPKSSCHC